MHRQTNILSAAFVITIFYGASMLLGILRDRLLVENFYQCCSNQLDVYWAAFRLPDTIFQLVVVGALSAAFIPVFSEYLLKDKKEAYHIAFSLITILGIVFLFLTFLIFLFARPLSELITGAFSPAQIDLMVSLTRIMLVAQFFFLISNFLTGIIQSHQRFIVPALSPVVYNIGIIVGIVFLSPYLGIYGPAIGVVLGAFLHFLVQFPLLFRLGVPYRFKIDFKNEGVKEILKLMVPRSVALAVSQLEATVTLFLATSLASGSLTIFYLATHIMQLPITLVGIPIGQATLPVLSQKRNNDFSEFKRVFLSSFWQILYLALPATIILLVLRIPVVRLAFGAKGFPWTATILTGQVLALFSFAIISQAIIQLLVRGFYALHNTRTPLFIGLIAVTSNIILSILLTFNLKWGVLGLAVSTSITSVIHLALLFIYLHRTVHFEKNTFLAPLTKMLIATAMTAIFLWAPMRFLDRFVLNTTKTIDLIILTIVAGLVGILVYLIISWLLKIEEMKTYLGLARKVGQWRKVLEDSEEILEPQLHPQSSTS